MFCSSECKKLFGVSQVTRDKISVAVTGKTGGWRNFGGNGIKGEYEGWLYQSSWERAWIIYHLTENIPFRRCTEYFTYSFDGKQRKYYPDFYLTELSTYVEVKGFWSDKTAAKIAAIPEGFSVLVVGKDEIKPMLEYADKVFTDTHHSSKVK